MSDKQVMPQLEEVSTSKSRNEFNSQDIESSKPRVHHAHHLKYGEVSTSGFAPPSVNEDDLSDVDEICRRHTPDREHRRRKMTRDRSMEALDAEARRIHAQRRYLFRRPRAHQYFRGTTLVRSDEERSSGRLELFFDLTFVGIIAVLAEEAVAEPTGASLVRYLITYTAAYNVWSSMREVFNSFYNDDISQKILVLFVMCCLVIYGNNAPNVQQNLSEGPARAATIASYLLAKLALFSTFFYYSFHIKSFRAQIRFHTAMWLIAAGIYIGSIFVDVKSAVAMAVVALAIEVLGWPLAYSGIFQRLVRLRYSSAINLEHEVDRFNDFYTLVIGEFIFSLFSGSPVGSGVHIAAFRAVLAVIIAFVFQVRTKR
jgi:low temperature requirement protein LtrA